jgi:arginyl-tRNA synthetase
MSVTVKQRLTQVVEEALGKAQADGSLAVETMPAVALDRPPDRSLGDFSANIAMLLARPLHLAPREVAQRLLAHLEPPADLVAETTIAGAGFINFRLAPSCLHDVVRRVHAEDEAYGRSDGAAGKRLQVEFVSANPTGPLGVHHARGGAIGDALGNILAAVGYEVQREFYVNDAPGSLQMRKFGESLDACYRKLLGEDCEVPEDGYRGDYMTEIARGLCERDGDRHLQLDSEERIAKFVELGQVEMFEQQQADLQAFGVRYDRWFRERTLYEEGAVSALLDELREAGHTYEHEGALWLRTTAFGDSKDRPIVRANGVPTYLAGDLAYHANKFRRGFDQLVEIWGADHHGHIIPTKAGVAALGYDPERARIVIYQLVRLFRGKDLVRMSKRAGDIALLSEFLAEVGKDAARFFFLMRSSDSHLDFDLELAKKESPENPVYYVQYAHARICSILAGADKASVAIPDPQQADLSMLDEPEELALMGKLADFPDEVATAAMLYEPHRMTRYAQELAAVFHTCYTKHRVLGDDPALTAARLVLMGASRITLRNTLALMGISAPERMVAREETP